MGGDWARLNELLPNIIPRRQSAGETFVSVYFSYLADELTEIEERLMEADLAPYSAPLRRAIAKAFELACEAGRAQRTAEDSQAETTKLVESLKFLPPRAAA